MSPREQSMGAGFLRDDLWYFVQYNTSLLNQFRSCDDAALAEEGKKICMSVFRSARPTETG
jgi:hypothetical protein